MDTDISFEIITLYNPSKEPFEIVYNNRIFRTIPPGKAMRLPKKPFGILAEKHLIDRMCNLEGKPTNDPIARTAWRKAVVIDEDIDNSEKVLDPSDVMQRKLDRLNNTNESGAVITCDVCGTKSFNLQEHKTLNHPVTVPQAPTVPVAPVLPAQQVTVTQPVTPPAQQPLITPDQVTKEKVQLVSTSDPETIPANPVLNERPQKERRLQSDPTDDVKSVISGVTGTVKEEHHELPAQKVEEEQTPTYTVNPNPTREELISYAKSIGMNIEDPKTKSFLDTADIPTLKKELNYGI